MDSSSSNDSSAYWSGIGTALGILVAILVACFIIRKCRKRNENSISDKDKHLTMALSSSNTGGDFGTSVGGLSASIKAKKPINRKVNEEMKNKVLNLSLYSKREIKKDRFEIGGKIGSGI